VTDDACRWTLDTDDTEGDSFFTSCGERSVVDGDPKEHGMRFCWYCGKSLAIVIPARADVADEDDE
jgi:hypothetical protein